MSTDTRRTVRLHDYSLTHCSALIQISGPLVSQKPVFNVQISL